MKKGILFCSLFIGLLQTGFSQNLDPTFGNHGIVKSDLGVHFNYNNAGKEILVQPDGSTYLVFANSDIHYDIDGSPYPTTVQKLLPDGTVDVSYGADGLSIPLPIYSAHAAIQSDGKIVVAGFTLAPGQLCSCGTSGANRTNFAIGRLNTDGTEDNTFNGGNIKVISLRNENYITALAIQNDGKIVFTGDAQDEFVGNYLALLRINADGSIDPAFNETETVMNNATTSIGLQSDGKILVGETEEGMPSLRRFNTDGSFDNTFNGTGIEVLDFGANGYLTALAVQSDDKIVVGGYTYNGVNADFEVARVNPDGGLDNTFDGDGVQTIDFAGGNDSLRSVAIETGGKIVTGGYTAATTNTDFAIARLNADGTLDNTFGTDGKQTTDFGLFSSKDYINSIAIQSDGKLIALGYAFNGTNAYIAVARYNTNGSSDMSFNACGTLVPLIGQGNTKYTSTVVQADSKILAAGYTWDGARYNFVIARYNTDGSLDNTFSDDGVQTTVFGSADSKAYGIAIQADGKIVVGGTVGNYCGLARYNADGSADNTFAGTGTVTTDFGAFDSVSIAIQGDGKILIGGTSLARYNSNGSPDLSFSGDGKITSFGDGNPLNCSSIAIQNDGKIVLSGVDRGFDGFVIVRFNADGSPDNTFNGNGEKGIFSQVEFDIARGKTTIVQNDGKILVAGYNLGFYHASHSTFLLLRLNADGDFDPAFNGGNIVYKFAGDDNLAYGMSAAIQTGNKIIVGGYSYNSSSPEFTILRYNPDGSLDNNFNGNGIVITQASSAYNRISGIALDGDRLYAAGFGQYPGNFGVVARYNVPSEALPVTLAGFTATLQNKLVLLQWQTESEQNLLNFDVERSNDGRTFSQIGDVAARGNSSIKINYSTIDRQPLQGINIYRLKIFDKDGEFRYSKIVSVNVNSQNTVTIFPNPAGNLLFVQANGNNEAATLVISDVLGKKLRSAKVILNGNIFTLDISDLRKGTYNLVLFNSKGIETQQFIKQ